jgi:hypothetical protein
VESNNNRNNNRNDNSKNKDPDKEKTFDIWDLLIQNAVIVSDQIRRESDSRTFSLLM